MTSLCNRNTVHALTTHPTNPKFGKAIMLKLSQKITTPQVTRPVIVAIHICANKIHVCNKKKKLNHQQSRIQPNSQTPPSNSKAKKKKKK